MMETMAEAAFQLGRKHVIVVRGQDGLDEVTLTGPTDIIERDDQGLHHHTITPEDF